MFGQLLNQNATNIPAKKERGGGVGGEEIYSFSIFTYTLVLLTLFCHSCPGPASPDGGCEGCGQGTRPGARRPRRVATASHRLQKTRSASGVKRGQDETRTDTGCARVNGLGTREGALGESPLRFITSPNALHANASQASAPSPAGAGRGSLGYLLKAFRFFCYVFGEGQGIFHALPLAWRRARAAGR